MVDVNLIPVSVHHAQICREHLKRWAISIVVALSALGVSYGMEWARRAEAAELQTRAQQLQESVSQVRTHLATVQAKAKQVLQQIERAKALRAKRCWSGMFALIDSCMPESCWLTSIATDPVTPAGQSRPSTARAIRKPEEPQHEAVTIETPRRLRIAGFAMEPTEPLEFVIQLQKQGAFSLVWLVNSAREPVLDGIYFRFEIVCEWQS